MAVLLETSDKRVTPGQAPSIDLSVGGQNGMMTQPHLWVQSTNYVPQKLILVLISAPTGMQYMPEGLKEIATLKALIELLPTTVEGWKNNRELEFAEAVMGHSGEMMEEETKVTRPRSVPVFMWKNKYNNAIPKFWMRYIDWLMRNPVTQIPDVVTTAAYEAAGAPPLLADFKSFSVLAFEPDPTYRMIVNAWLTSNMRPKSSGDTLGKRGIQEASEGPDVSVEFTGHTEYGANVDRLALKALRSMKLADLRPNDLRIPYDDIQPIVAASGTSFANAIATSVTTPA